MKTIGKMSLKPYECTECGNELEICTNHWGECYPVCTVCNKQTVHTCTEPLPEGYSRPAKWKFAELGTHVGNTKVREFHNDTDDKFANKN